MVQQVRKAHRAIKDLKVYKVRKDRLVLMELTAQTEHKDPQGLQALRGRKV